MIRILLIEDNVHDAELITRGLITSLGDSIHVTHVLTLQQAKVALIEPQNAYRLVIVDLMLPDSSGLSTLTALTELESNIPLMILSGVSDNKIQVQALELGASIYISKNTLDWQELADIVIKVLYAAKAKACIRCDVDRQIQQLNANFKGLTAQLETMLKNDQAIDARLQQMERWVFGVRNVDTIQDGALDTVAEFRRYKKLVLGAFGSAILAIILGVINRVVQ